MITIQLAKWLALLTVPHVGGFSRLVASNSTLMTPLAKALQSLSDHQAGAALMDKGLSSLMSMAGHVHASQPPAEGPMHTLLHEEIMHVSNASNTLYSFKKEGNTSFSPMKVSTASGVHHHMKSVGEHANDMEVSVLNDASTAVIQTALPSKHDFGATLAGESEKEIDMHGRDPLLFAPLTTSRGSRSLQVEYDNVVLPPPAEGAEAPASTELVEDRAFQVENHALGRNPVVRLETQSDSAVMGMQNTQFVFKLFMILSFIAFIMAAPALIVTLGQKEHQHDSTASSQPAVDPDKNEQEGSASECMDETTAQDFHGPGACAHMTSDDTAAIKFMAERGFSVPSVDVLMMPSLKKMGPEGRTKDGAEEPELAWRRETQVRRKAMMDILRNLPDISDTDTKEEDSDPVPGSL